MSLARRNPRRDANEGEIVDYLRSRGALVHQLSGPGLPDLLVGWCGRWLLLEVKRASNPPTAAQELFLSVARRGGLPVHIIRSVPAAREVLDGHSRRTRP